MSAKFEMNVSDLISEDIEAYLHQHQHKSMLRFLTCGSVDDGKSTLIGRLLYDSKMIFEDQLAALEADSKKVGTQGCYPLTGAIESTASTLPEIIQEMLLTTTSERQGRKIDHDQAASMEKKKQEGYF